MAAVAASSAAHAGVTFDSVKAEIYMLVDVIKGIRLFDGRSGSLKEFAFMAMSAHNQLTAASAALGEVRVQNLYNMLVCRIDENVRADVGMTFITPVNEMISKLKARYAGDRRPVERAALKLFRMRRESGETPQRFAHRLDAAMRTLKERAVEEWGATAAAPKIAAYEGVAREALMAEMPDKVRRQLRENPASSLDAAQVIANDEEDEVRELREERQWATVEPKSQTAGMMTTDNPDRGRPSRLCAEEIMLDLRKLSPFVVGLLAEETSGSGAHGGERNGDGPSREAASDGSEGPSGQRGIVRLFRRKRIVSEWDRLQRDAGEDSAREDVCDGCGTAAASSVSEGLLVSDREGPRDGIGPPTYQVILGADALRPLRARVTAGSDEWRVRLRKTCYRSVKLVTKGEYVGAAVVRSPDAVTSKNVRDKFHEVFYVEGDPIPATGRVTHHIELESDRPVYVKPRRYPKAQAAVIEKEIKLMLERGVIRKSVSPFCSPLWVVPKPPAGDGTPRYPDFRELNKRTRTERYPLPSLEEMLDRMHGAKLKTAPTTFQRLMDEFLEGLDPNAIQVYTDDIIVFCKSKVEHCTHRGQLLRRLTEFWLKASEEKSSFFQAELKFMGHTWAESGPELPPAEPGPSAGTEQMSSGEEVGQLSWSHTIVNNKPRQVILEAGTEQGVTVTHTRYARTRTWTVTTESLASDDEDRKRLNRLYATGRLGSTRWKGALFRVRTVTDTDEQRRIVEEYHVGKTNHRGAQVLTDRTADRVCEGLLAFFGTVGLPGALVMDKGWEFNNAKVRTLLKEFHVNAHFTTPGHPRSHGTVERLHSTIMEHLFLLKLDRGLEGSEAIARAILAYNNSPLERPGRSPGGSKEKRTEAVNERRASDRWERIRVGDTTWVKNWYRRRKEDKKFVWPFRVVRKLTRFRVRVQDVVTGKVRVVHVNETRVPRSGEAEVLV
ncbi:hypothetical protein AAG570_002129 [Ranatra chinensis]|uniref:Integrase catalytic domain-containing protein n=1 Tax=Ranatra chinensis TaxID=642074 RepID=A0ABD0Y6M5_9HEMI